MKTVPSKSTANKGGQPPAITFAIALGLIGATLNSFSLPFLPQVELILGNAVIIIAAMYLTPKLTLATAFIAVAPLYITWGHPFGFVTFGLEALFISYFRQKGHYVLFADIGYWCLIGMPLSAIIVWFFGQQENVYWLFISLKQGFNAAIYTTLGCLIAFVFEHKLPPTWQRQPPLKRRLKQQLNYAIVLIVTLALTTTALFITRNLILTTQEIVETTLEDRAVKFAELIDTSLHNHQSAITLGANWLSSETNQHWQSSLEKIHRSYTGFTTMLIADPKGNITNASPRRFLSVSSSLNVADREYFKEAMIGQHQYMSPIFKGRGFGKDAIVTISQPIYQHVGDNQPIGIVQGSVDLSFIGRLTGAHLGTETIKVVVTDQHNNTIFAHPSLNLAPLTLFNAEPIIDSSMQDRLLLSTLPQQQFAYAATTTKNGWKVYTLIEYSITIREIEREYMVIFITLIITLMIAATIAHRFGSRITRPLRFIIKQVNQFDEHTIDKFKPLHNVAAIEIEQLYEELKSDKQAVHEYQQQLEEKVQERTKELNQANQQLQQQALIDGLTKVHNRCYLDDNFELIQKTAQRNMALMSVIMLDLDHFKELNDQYGHLVGDQVLKQVAKLIKQEFSRETDTVVRFGGEEFLVIAPYVTAAALANKLETLRTAIAHYQFINQVNNSFNTSASFGAIIADAAFANNIITWVKVADKCLYQAKAQGRNQVVIEDKISRATP